MVSGSRSVRGIWIPTGYSMIRDFKAQIFCRENNLSKREIDTGDRWLETPPMFPARATITKVKKAFQTTATHPARG